jgi:hypothetical protein
MMCYFRFHPRLDGQHCYPRFAHTQAQPSTFNKKIQLTRSLSLLYFMLSNILYGFEQIVSLFSLALPNSPAQLGIPTQHLLQPSAQLDLTCVLPSPPAQPPHPIKRQPRASPFCIAGPRPPPQTPVPAQPPPSPPPYFPHAAQHRRRHAPCDLLPHRATLLLTRPSA